MPQKQHVMHGRDHCPTGADPIPCLITPGGAHPEFVDYIESLGPYGYWRLGETAGPFADTSGRFPLAPGDATLVDRGADLATDQTGALTTTEDDGAILVPPSGDYLQVTNGDTSRYDFDSALEAFTVMAWVKVNANPATFTGAVIHNLYSSPPEGWALLVNWPARTVTWSRQAVGGTLYAVTSPTLAVDTWYHLAGVYDPAAPYSIELFVDGESVGTQATAGAGLPVWSNGPQIGGGEPNASQDYYFDGLLDEVVIFDAALTEAQIDQAVTSGLSGGAADAGTVPTSDGEGGTTWAYPTVKVDGARYDEIIPGSGLAATDNADGTVTLDASGGDPADDTSVWLPLTTVTGGNPEPVWDADDSLIPTLTPI